MGVFETVFTKRGSAEAEESPASGAFEEVFVRRGRWRKQPASTLQPSSSDVLHLAEQVGAELPEVSDPVPILIEAVDAELGKVLHTASAHPNTSLRADMAGADMAGDTIFPGINDPTMTIITDSVQLVVKNGFLTTEGLDYDSLKAFLKDRKVKSCPASRNISFDTKSSFRIEDIICKSDVHSRDESILNEGHFDTASSFGDSSGLVLVDSAPKEVAFNTASTFMDADFERCFQGNSEVPAVIVLDACMTQGMSMVPPPPPPGVAPAPPAVLRLAEAIAPPELGGPGLPSIGSLLHHTGECKPCTFFHTRGCENKEDCQFCHLCKPGEKKKRLKAVKRAQRDETLTALENAKATLASWSAAEALMEVDMIVE